MDPDTAIKRMISNGVRAESLALYGRWLQAELWLRELAYLVLRSKWGSAWEDELDNRARRYAENDDLVHLTGSNEKDLIDYLDFSLLLKIISGNWELFEQFLIKREVWDGRALELKSIRNRVGHLRQPLTHDRNRIELTLRDLEPGFREVLRALQPQPVAAGSRMGDPVVEGFFSTKLPLGNARAHALRTYELESELQFSSMPWAETPTAPASVSGTPGALWHMDLGGPVRWLDIARLSRMIAPIRDWIVFVLASSPGGVQLLMPAVDDGPQIVRAMTYFVENYASCTMPLKNVGNERLDTWPGDIAEIDTRILIDHQFAYSLSPDEPGTPFGT